MRSDESDLGFLQASKIGTAVLILGLIYGGFQWTRSPQKAVKKANSQEVAESRGSESLAEVEQHQLAAQSGIPVESEAPSSTEPPGNALDRRPSSVEAPKPASVQELLMKSPEKPGDSLRHESQLESAGRPYRLRPDLVAIPVKDLPKGLEVFGQAGGRAFVLASASVGLSVSEGVVVQDALNQKIGLLTGALWVQVREWESRSRLQKFGLRVRSEYPVSRSLFLQSGATNPEQLSSLQAALAADPLVEQVQLEILKNQRVPR